MPLEYVERKISKAFLPSATRAKCNVTVQLFVTDIYIEHRPLYCFLQEQEIWNWVPVVSNFGFVIQRVCVARSRAGTIYGETFRRGRRRDEDRQWRQRSCALLSGIVPGGRCMVVSELWLTVWVQGKHEVKQGKYLWVTPTTKVVL